MSAHQLIEYTDFMMNVMLFIWFLNL